MASSNLPRKNPSNQSPELPAEDNPEISAESVAGDRAPDDVKKADIRCAQCGREVVPQDILCKSCIWSAEKECDYPRMALATAEEVFEHSGIRKNAKREFSITLDGRQWALFLSIIEQIAAESNIYTRVRSMVIVSETIRYQLREQGF